MDERFQDIHAWADHGNILTLPTPGRTACMTRHNSPQAFV